MKRLFIADDNKDLLGLMHTFLSRNYNVYCSAGSENIFKEIAGFNPHLIIIDNSLGNTSAETIIENIRKKDGTFSTPFLLFSAHPSIREIAAKIGADGYIEKPFVVKDARAYIDKIIQKTS